MCDPLGVCTRRHVFFFTSTSEQHIPIPSIGETKHEPQSARSASGFSAQYVSHLHDGTSDTFECNEAPGTEDIPAEYLDDIRFSRRHAFASRSVELKRSRSCPGLIERAVSHLDIADLSANGLSRKPSSSSVSTAFFSARSRQRSVQEDFGEGANQLGENHDAEDEHTESSKALTEKQPAESSVSEPQQCEKTISREGVAQEIDMSSAGVISSSVEPSSDPNSPVRSLKRTRSTMPQETLSSTVSAMKKRRTLYFKESVHGRHNTEDDRGRTLGSKPAPLSIFRTSDWECVDQSVFNYRPAKDWANANSKGTAVSPLARLIHHQLDHAHVQDKASLELGSRPIQNQRGASEPVAATRGIVSLDQNGDASMEDNNGFVSAISKFNEIISGCDAIQRFKDMPTRCLANKLDGSRCRSNTPSGPSSDIESLLLDLVKLDFSENIPRGINALAKLTHLAICRYQRHHVWRSLYSLLRINEGYSLNRPRSMLSSTTAETRNGYLQLRSSPFEEETVTSLPDATTTDWLKDLRAQVPQHLPVYLSYHSPESRPRNINDLLREEAMKPLYTSYNSERFSGLDERRSGYIYVYWNRASFGLMKIGCTTRDVEARIREWEEQCHHIADEQYRSAEPINNVAKVEKLLHTEFRQHRVLEPICHGCGRSHIEWFQGLDLRNVIARIEAWTQWISQEPYESCGNYNLKATMHDNIPLIGIGAHTDSATPRSTPASPRRSPRYDLRRRFTARMVDLM